MRDTKDEIIFYAEPSKDEIIFYAEPSKWFIKINKGGIFFNREIYPDCGPDDFAEAFINILEKEFTVKFEKRTLSGEE